MAPSPAFGPPAWYGEEIAGGPTSEKTSIFENWPAFADADCTAAKLAKAAPPAFARTSRREPLPCTLVERSRAFGTFGSV